MHEVIMPKLGLTMESGKIEKWHKKEGDKVNEGDVLFEVMTDKVSLEVEAYNSGILKKILKNEEEEVPVTEVVAYIGEADEEIPEAPPEASGQAVSTRDTEEVKEKDDIRPSQAEGKPVKEEGGKITISPVAQKLARENNIDITKIAGSGPRGRIVKEDILNNLQSPGGPSGEARIKISPLARRTARESGIDYEVEKIAGSGPGGRIVKEDILAFIKSGKKAVKDSTSAAPGSARVKSSTKLKGMRKVIAERMSLSKSTIPHIVLNSKADATNLIDFREELKKKILDKYGVKVTYTDLIIKATAISLRENIGINSSLLGQDHIIYDDVNVGMAVSVEEGLIVPTIFSCDGLEIVDIARKRIELIEKARSGKLSLEEITNGTFTITNLGMFGIRNFSAIINPPQAAILAVGEIYSEPAVVDGKIEARSFMDLSTSCDHRIVDGAMGAKFLQKIVELVENPVMLEK